MSKAEPILCNVGLDAGVGACAGLNAPIGTALLNETQVRAQYPNCPSGYYTGPRPGQARYTKDPRLRVVTTELVSQELIGPEAMANTLVPLALAT